MENSEYSDIFEEIADLLELKEANQFRVRSYRDAARNIRGLSKRIDDMIEEEEDLTKIDAVGSSMGDKIHEIHNRGSCERLEQLRDELPSSLSEVMAVPYVGPRKAMQLHRELGIENLDELRKAAENNRIRDLEGMGAKTESKILDGIQTVEKTADRILLNDAMDHAESLGRHLNALKSVDEWVIAGSYRRRKETVGDLDILIRAQDRQSAADEITEHELIADVVGRGKERITIRTTSGLQVDFRFFDASSFGSAMLYFTGSKAHNIKLRKRAQQHEWKLNEYGLSKGDQLLAGSSEESVYHRLNLTWIPPELREDEGEIEAATEHDLPELIEAGDLRGDLHCHSDASDGTTSVQEMADAAVERGHDYLAITDHSKAVSVTQGLDEKRLGKHAEHIRRIGGGRNDIALLAGIEVDILKDGTLDLEQEALADLDYVVASIHSFFNLDEDDMTDRLCRAIESGVVHCLGHPAGRMLGKRQSISCDFERVFNTCAEYNVALEINAQPMRMDLPDTLCRSARDAGAKLVIATDAHKPADLDLLPLGVSVARRGWLRRKDVLNTATAAQLRKRLTA
jgi:DNA polymerase (family 10)